MIKGARNIFAASNGCKTLNSIKEISMVNRQSTFSAQMDSGKLQN
jgi:hypothetical protein